MIFSVEGKNFAEIKEQLLDFAKGLGLELNQAQLEIQFPTTATKQKREKKEKAVDETPAPAVVADIETPKADPTPTPAPVAAPVSSLAGKSDALAALTKLNNEKGMPAAREVLLALGYTKLGDVKVADYGKLIDLCNEKLSA